jgi:hypothetical protein
MIASAIREIAAARTSPLICAAFFEGNVQVWDLKAQQQTSEFSARFASGARTLAMDPAAELIVAGVSAKRGSVASYTVPDGKAMWIRNRVEH